ncbi:MAG: hypothetical protein ACJ75J_13700 [Cytophagaceae bacterium]
MGKSYNYRLKGVDGKDLGHLLINEIPQLNVKIAHLYNFDDAHPDVLENFALDKDYISIAKELLLKTGNDRPFLIVEGLNLDEF